MAKTILVVDDTANIRRMVTSYLAQDGFRVVTAADGREALLVAHHEQPDLIILDLMMPNMGGYEFIRAYNKVGEAPIIVLTARLDEDDKVLGLELGADDYVTKPFSPRELTARVRAVLRRASKDPFEPDLLRVADVRLDRDGRMVTAAGRQVDLTPSEFDLLATLMAAPGTRVPPHDRARGAQIEVDGAVVGWLLGGSGPRRSGPGSPKADLLARITQAITYSALGATALALVLGGLLARTLTHPLRELTAATQAVAKKAAGPAGGGALTGRIGRARGIV